MTSLKLDSSNNLIFGYTFFETSGKERILQDIKTTISLVVGENPFNDKEGFDFLGYLKNKNDSPFIKKDIIEACKKIEGVKDVILEIDNDFNIQNFIIKTVDNEDLKIG